MTERFMCSTCGDAFELPDSVRQKYPNWTPKDCMPCRDKKPAKKARGGAKGRGGARGSGGAQGKSVSREQNLTTAQVLEQFEAQGPQTGVFTDGSCQGNPGPGGWGAVFVQDGKVMEQLHGADPSTTNNRMELMAMIEGLSMLGRDEEATIFSDSQLVVNTLTKWAAGWEKRGWKRKDGEVKNLDLVQEAYELSQARPKVRIEWLRAHDGSLWNEYADSLATAYARETL